MKKLITLLLALTFMMAMSTVSIYAADKAVATTMKMAGVEGSISVVNASGKDVNVKNDMRLLSDYTIKTGAASYAYISLDDSKAVKLDQNTKVTVEKTGKKIELTIKSGQIFFDVDKKLSGNESMNIKTGNMTTGVRGTAGVIGVSTERVASTDDSVGKQIVNTDIVLLSGELGVKQTGAGDAAVTSALTAGNKLSLVGEASIGTSGGTASGGEAVVIPTQPPAMSAIGENDVSAFATVAIIENAASKQGVDLLNSDGTKKDVLALLTEVNVNGINLSKEIINTVEKKAEVAEQEIKAKEEQAKQEEIQKEEAIKNELQNFENVMSSINEQMGFLFDSIAMFEFKAVEVTDNFGIMADMNLMTEDGYNAQFFDPNGMGYIDNGGGGGYYSPPPLPFAIGYVDMYDGEYHDPLQFNYLPQGESPDTYYTYYLFEGENPEIAKDFVRDASEILALGNEQQGFDAAAFEEALRPTYGAFKYTPSKRVKNVSESGLRTYAVIREGETPVVISGTTLVDVIPYMAYPSWTIDGDEAWGGKVTFSTASAVATVPAFVMGENFTFSFDSESPTGPGTWHATATMSGIDTDNCIMPEEMGIEWTVVEKPVLEFVTYSGVYDGQYHISMQPTAALQQQIETYGYYELYYFPSEHDMSKFFDILENEGADITDEVSISNTLANYSGAFNEYRQLPRVRDVPEDGGDGISYYYASVPVYSKVGTSSGLHSFTGSAIYHISPKAITASWMRGGQVQSGPIEITYTGEDIHPVTAQLVGICPGDEEYVTANIIWPEECANNGTYTATLAGVAASLPFYTPDTHEGASSRNYCVVGDGAVFTWTVTGGPSVITATFTWANAESSFETDSTAVSEGGYETSYSAEELAQLINENNTLKTINIVASSSDTPLEIDFGAALDLSCGQSRTITFEGGNSCTFKFNGIDVGTTGSGLQKLINSGTLASTQDINVGDKGRFINESGAKVQITGDHGINIIGDLSDMSSAGGVLTNAGIISSGRWDECGAVSVNMGSFANLQGAELSRTEATKSIPAATFYPVVGHGDNWAPDKCSLSLSGTVKSVSPSQAVLSDTARQLKYLFGEEAICMPNGYNPTSSLEQIGIKLRTDIMTQTEIVEVITRGAISTASADNSFSVCLDSAEIISTYDSTAPMDSDMILYSYNSETGLYSTSYRVTQFTEQGEQHINAPGLMISPQVLTEKINKAYARGLYNITNTVIQTPDDAEIDLSGYRLNFGGGNGRVTFLGGNFTLDSVNVSGEMQTNVALNISSTAALRLNSFRAEQNAEYSSSGLNVVNMGLIYMVDADSESCFEIGCGTFTNTGTIMAHVPVLINGGAFANTGAVMLFAVPSQNGEGAVNVESGTLIQSGDEDAYIKLGTALQVFADNPVISIGENATVSVSSGRIIKTYNAQNPIPEADAANYLFGGNTEVYEIGEISQTSESEYIVCTGRITKY